MQSINVRISAVSIIRIIGVVESSKLTYILQEKMDGNRVLTPDNNGAHCNDFNHCL
jgi:hypothetical protein